MSKNTQELIASASEEDLRLMRFYAETTCSNIRLCMGNVAQVANLLQGESRAQGDAAEFSGPSTEMAEIIAETALLDIEACQIKARLQALQVKADAIFCAVSEALSKVA